MTNYGKSLKVEPKGIKKNTWILELEDVEKVTSRLLAKVRSEDRKVNSTKSQFKKDDVIYGKLRPYLDKAIIADEVGVCTTEMIPISGYKKILPQYLRWYLKSPFFINYANSSTHGMNLPRLGTDKARLGLFSLPPYEEQIRIAERIDSLLSSLMLLEKQKEEKNKKHIFLNNASIDKLLSSQKPSEFKANWKRISDNFDLLYDNLENIGKLKQAILQLAVMGKLVPQDPKDEPASVLLDKIKKEKEKLIREGKLKKEKPLPPINDEEKPYELPKGWGWCRLGELLKYTDSGWSPACNTNPAPKNKWGVLKTTSVQDFQFLEFENKELPQKLDPKPQYEANVEDILITRAGPTNRVGICCYVDTVRPKLMISDKIIRMHAFDKLLHSKYLVLCLNSPPIKELINSIKSGMAASQVNISQVNLKNILIPIPCKHNQIKLCKTVEKLWSLCESLTNKFQEKETIASKFSEAAI